jgi:hypothetical protein
MVCFAANDCIPMGIAEWGSFWHVGQRQFLRFINQKLHKGLLTTFYFYIRESVVIS